MLIELQIPLEEGEEQRILQSLRCKRFIDYALEEYEGIEVFLITVNGLSFLIEKIIRILRRLESGWPNRSMKSLDVKLALA